jgi:hypothetical protein
MNSCEHKEEVIDQHEGSIICINCGIVKDVVYESKNCIAPSFLQEKNYSAQSKLSYIDNILDKLNFSDYYQECLNKDIPLKKRQNLKLVTSKIYQKINADQTVLPLKTLLNISGLSPKHVKSNKVHVLKVTDLVEKYVKMLGFNYATCTVIKEKVKQIGTNNGYQPLSIIGGVIYLHFQEKQHKIPMKIIASHLGISAISIQRFIKYVLSSRT